MSNAPDQTRRLALLAEGRERLAGLEPVLRTLAALAILPSAWPPALRQTLEYLVKSAEEIGREELGEIAQTLMGLPSLRAPGGGATDRRPSALSAGVEKLRRLLDEALADQSGENSAQTEGLVDVTASCPDCPDSVVMSVPGSALAQARGQGLHLWALWLEAGSPPTMPGPGRGQFLADLDSLGSLLFSDLDQGQGSWRHCLLASVMEDGEMLASALELPATRLGQVSEGALTAVRTGQASPASSAAPRAAAAPASPQGGDQSARPESIRVQVGLIERLIALAGELVLGRNQLKSLLGDDARRAPGLGTLLQGLGQVTTQVQQNIMMLRMQPLGTLLGRFPRVVREIARQTGKEAELTILGGEVELDKSILEQLSDPLTHLLRNCLDHGLEKPEERVRLGKPRTGQVVIMGFHEEGMVNIAVHDDGRGINAEDVAAKAVAAGLVGTEDVRRLSASEKLALITLPGVSTARAVTDLSGRGVGMDVVATNIARMGGNLQIESDMGVGTTIRLRLPLTLAIIPSLVVGSAGHVFAIPQADVQELLLIQSRQSASRIELVGGAPVVRLRERLLPLVRLADVLGLSRRFAHPATGDIEEDRRRRIADRRSYDLTLSIEEEEALEEEGRRDPQTDRRRRRSDDIHIAVLRTGSHRYGLIVDQLFDTEEIVVKPLPRLLKGCQCFGGATIMGDGRVAMIVDAGGIARQARLRFGEISAQEESMARERARMQVKAARPKTSLVLFRYSPGELFAVPLASVSRLERLEVDTVRSVGGRRCMAYQGGALALLYLDRYLPVQPLPQIARHMYVILPRAGGGEAGLVASEVLDILETELDIRHYPGPQRGVVGLCEVAGRLTLLLDLEGLLEAFGQDEPTGAEISNRQPDQADPPPPPAEA